MGICGPSTWQWAWVTELLVEQECVEVSWLDAGVQVPFFLEFTLQWRHQTRKKSTIPLT